MGSIRAETCAAVRGFRFNRCLCCARTGAKECTRADAKGGHSQETHAEPLTRTAGAVNNDQTFEPRSLSPRLHTHCLLHQRISARCLLLNPMCGRTYIQRLLHTFAQIFLSRRGRSGGPSATVSAGRDVYYERVTLTDFFTSQSIAQKFPRCDYHPKTRQAPILGGVPAVSATDYLLLCSLLPYTSPRVHWCRD